MCLGFSGSPMSSLKSKADALKYAIEFTATGEYPNRAPDIKKAKELYNFICENVQLPEDNIDNNRLYMQILHNNVRLNDFLEYAKQDRRKCNQEKPKPSGEVVGEQTKEAVISIPGSSYFSQISNNLRAVLRGYGFKCFCGVAANDFSKETFRLDGNGEYLDVTITHSTCPKKE